jgi:DNA-binding response OmpR family regulator
MEYKILLVDRDQTLLDLIKIVLQENRYSVKAVPDCRLAIELADLWKPNLIILDSNMENGDALRFIHANQFSSYIPILLLTATDTIQYAQECLDAGANEMISKPVSISEMLAKVNAFEHRLVSPAYQYRTVNSSRTRSIVQE